MKSYCPEALVAFIRYKKSNQEHAKLVIKAVTIRVLSLDNYYGTTRLGKV